MDVFYSRLLLLFMAFSCAGSIQAQQSREKQSEEDKIAWSLRISEVDIVARRPMKDIGVQETKLDTTMLRENIAFSMADVLTQNTTIFIKQYGRATLSTASFRGTSPSHTQVMWNGMKINSPMLGMVDFSMIPSYFIDDASLLHGTSSVNVTGGGLGGAINLATKPQNTKGFGLQYIQGISSFSTFDEFLRLTYGNKKWQTSTRVVYSSSKNDFKYKNYNKKELVLDNDYNIIGKYHPIERNKSGQFNDFHALQEIYYNTGKGNRFGLSAWYLNSTRGMPMLNVDYRNNADYTNEQKEQTFRGVLSWNRSTEQLKSSVKGGYIYTQLKYDYSKDLGNGEKANMIQSRSYVNTIYGVADVEYYIGNKWLFTAGLTLQQHFVLSKDKNIITQIGNKAVVGYDQSRTELSANVSAKYQPTDRLGISLVLREDMYGTQWTPLIPAFFTDYILSRKGNVIAKASVSRNFRFPTLNDQYFLPGGNPDLKKEHGFTYDAGVSFALASRNKFSVKGEITWFDSYIKDWIIWLPTHQGFWTPKNVKEVHAYGIEAKGAINANLSKDWSFALNGNFSWTPSINKGDPVNWADKAIGKQLVYIPKTSSAVTGQISYKSWRFTYKWCYYAERQTTSSNEMSTKIGRVKPYFMSDVTLEKLFSFPIAELSTKAIVNNLFNEHYESVLSRPMPRMNFGIVIDIRPRFGRN